MKRIRKCSGWILFIAGLIAGCQAIRFSGIFLEELAEGDIFIDLRRVLGCTLAVVVIIVVRALRLNLKEIEKRMHRISASSNLVTGLAAVIAGQEAGEFIYVFFRELARGDTFIDLTRLVGCLLAVTIIILMEGIKRHLSEPAVTP